MKKNLKNVIIVLLLIVMPTFLFGYANPLAPNLGTTSTFALYTKAGALTNTGVSAITGDIGSSDTAPVGFAGLVIGTIYPLGDPVLALAFADVGTAYTDLASRIPDAIIAVELAGQTLKRGVYSTLGPATLTGELILDGEGDPNAVFIIQIGGTFSMAGSSNVKLINSASASNVYWQIGGAVSLGGSATFKGTIIANGAINLTGTATLTGRGLSIGGAISTAANMVTLGVPLTVTANKVDGLCFGTGSATAIPAGGTAPYSYSWNTTPVQTTATASGLAAGTYTVTVTDATSSTATASVTITQPAALVASGSVTTPISCNGGNGVVTVTASGGTPPYTGTGTFTATGGSHTYIVTDANGCTATTSAVVVSEPAVLMASASVTTPISCNGGNGVVTVTASGGTPPYAGTGIFTAAAGSHTYIVTDANGCIATAIATVAQPPLLVMTSAAVSSPILCFGGTASVSIMANGGTPPYSYTFNGQTNATGLFIGVSAGLAKPYSITDASNCGPVTGNVDVVQPPLLALTGAAVSSPILCFGGTATVTIVANGGTPPYSYTFNGQTNTTGIFTGVLPGLAKLYSITDASNCGPVTGTLEVTQPPVLTGRVTSLTNVSIFGFNDGSVTVTGSGGTKPYLYKLGSIGFQVSGTFNSLTAGTYEVIIQDFNLCTFVVPVTITQPPVLTGVISNTNILCFGGTTGSVTAAGSGGTPPYTYKIGTGAYQPSGTFNSLSAGTYTVTLRDATLTSLMLSATITQPASAMTVSTTKTDIPCLGGATGTATAMGAGGTGPYSYSWNTVPVKTSATASGLVAGTYRVTAIDGNGCPASSNVTIVSQNSLPIAGFNSSLTGCMSYSFVNQSTNATTYAWDFGDSQTSGNVNPTNVYAKAGTYTVKLTASNNCGSDLKTQIINIPELEFFNGFSPNGDGQNDYWRIPVLDCYPVNNVLIINRWGSELWEGINYDNKKITWTGKNMKGEDLPDGTYFYIIKYSNIEKRGWVFIKR